MKKGYWSNHSVFLFVLKPGSDGFCTSMHKGSTWSREYVELFTFRAFYMLFKFFRDDTNLTVTAQVLHIVRAFMMCNVPLLQTVPVLICQRTLTI